MGDQAYDIGVLDHGHLLRFDTRGTLLFAFGSPACAGEVFDVINPHRLLKNRLTNSGVVCRVTKQTIDMHRPDGKLRIPTQREPTVTRQESEIAARIGVEMSGIL